MGSVEGVPAGSVTERAGGSGTPDRPGEPDRAGHWDHVHGTGEPATTSWHQPEPSISLELVRALGTGPDDPVLDVGGGTSALAGALLDRGHRDVSVLDVSEAALRIARERLSARAATVRWLVADLLAWSAPRRYRLWHDRAVFHFLTREDERRRYRDLLREAVAPGGSVLVGTFAADGPGQCSGLPTCGYDPDELATALGDGFEVRVARRVEHRTPWGDVQPFTWVGLHRP